MNKILLKILIELSVMHGDGIKLIKDDKRSFICNLGNGKLLIPLGAHPAWLLSNNTKIAINFGECNQGLTFSINEL